MSTGALHSRTSPEPAAHRGRVSIEQIDPWAVVVHAQHCVLTRGQLRDWGFTDDDVAHRTRYRHWQRVLHGVVALHTGPLTRAAVLRAALLYGGPWAVLSHRTAAQEWGLLRVVDEEPVHLTVPYGRSATPQPATWGIPGLVHPGVVVHRTRALAHVVAPTDPPRTSRPDTVVDCAVEEPTAPGAARQLVALISAGRVPVADVRRRLEQRPPRRYRRVLLGALDLMTAGVQSALEHRYVLDVEQAHALPTAHRQSPVVVDGHTLFEDVDYAATGVPLIVRLDGRRYHSLPTVAFRDRRRDNAAELAGRPRLVYGWDEVTGDPCGVAAEVRAVLERGGWSAGPPPCGRCASGR